MPLPVVDDPLGWCVASELRDCFCAQLAEVSAPVGCCCLYPGQDVPWDSCDPGMAWVRITQIYQVGDVFPQIASTTEPGPCGQVQGWAVTLELGALRCMPQPDRSGRLPGCEATSAVARLVYADAHAMRRALLCCDWRQRCANPGQDDAQLVLGPWQPLGPEGTCTGGLMTATVQVWGCICDDHTI